MNINAINFNIAQKSTFSSRTKKESDLKEFFEEENPRKYKKIAY